MIKEKNKKKLLILASAVVSTVLVCVIALMISVLLNRRDDISISDGYLDDNMKSFVASSVSELPGSAGTYSAADIAAVQSNSEPSITKSGDGAYLLLSPADFITLGIFSQTHDCAGMVFRIPTSPNIELTSAFHGIGSKTFPFRGTMVSIYDGYSINMPSNCSALFNFLSSSASLFETGLKPSLGANANSYGTIAQVLVADTATCKVNFDIVGGIVRTLTDSASGMVNAGGLFGKIQKGTSAVLTLDLTGIGTISTPSVTAGKSSGSAGGLIGLIENVEVTITADSIYLVPSVTAVGFNAGGIVGTITTTTTTDSASLDLSGVSSNMNFTGKTVIATQGDAGMIAGLAKSPLILPAATTITGGTVTAYKYSNAGGNAGGVIGNVPVSSVASSLSGVTISAAVINGGASAGGLIGRLSNAGFTLSSSSVTGTMVSSDFFVGGAVGGVLGSGVPGASGDISIVNVSTNVLLAPLTSVQSTGAGGLIGGAQMTTISNTLTISGGTVIATLATGYTSYSIGGVVGNIFQNTTYCCIKDDISATLANSSADIYNSGAAVGILQQKSFLDIGAGKFTHSAKSSVYNAIVGTTYAGSVVRFTGALSTDTTSEFTVVRYQYYSLIFSDSTSFSFNSNVPGNDIGNSGQIIRNESVKFDHLITFNPTAHTVTTAPFDTNIDSVTEFAAMGIAFTTSNLFGNINGVTMGSTININTDIDLTDTGIENLNGTGGGGTNFTGTINGNGHTITLDIGKRVRNTSALYKGITSNDHSYTGLFACVAGATFNNLTVAGHITYFDGGAAVNHEYPVYTGGYAAWLANTPGYTTTLNNCVTEVVIQSAHNYMNNGNHGAIGGFFGKGSVDALVMRGCTSEANITYWGNTYVGGFIGYLNVPNSTSTGPYDFSNSTVKPKLVVNPAPYNSSIISYPGGLVGWLQGYSNTTIDVVLDGIDTTGTFIDGTNTYYVGGVLGHTWKNVYVHIDDYASTKHPVLNGTVKVANYSNTGGMTGGLFNALGASGGSSVMHIGANSTVGVKIQSDKDVGGLAYDADYALIIVETHPDNYNPVFKTFDDSGINLGAHTDYFVTNNIYGTTYGSSGVLSIGMGNDGNVGRITDTALRNKWATKLNTRINTIAWTRYFFNVGYLFTEARMSSLYSGTINNEGDFMLAMLMLRNDSNLWRTWKDNAGYGINSYMATNAFQYSFNITADLDMSNRTFYPIETNTVSMNFNNHTLNFGLFDSTFIGYQFFNAQAGLFTHLRQQMIISNLHLSGKINRYYHSSGAQGSGALICLQVLGSTTANDTSTPKNITINNITLDGLSVVNMPNANPWPLLVNEIINHNIEFTVDGIKTGIGYTPGVKVATSLFGEAGYTSSTKLKFSFKNVVLDGLASSAIFRDATFFHSVNYNVGGNNSVSYNFNIDEDWPTDGSPLHQVTYGKELQAQETEYADADYYVNRDARPTSLGTVQDWTAYLPYVFKIGDGNIFAVNVKFGSLIEGWGTYRHPYIIDTVGKLYAVYSYIAFAQTMDNWQANYPVNVDTPTAYKTYTMINGILSDGVGGTLAPNNLRSWLCGAYYEISESIDITKKNDFAGIGTQDNPFHGVIIGNSSTPGNPIVIKPNSITSGLNGYGFVSVANGCVVKDLTFDYSGAKYNMAPGIRNSYFGGVIGLIKGGDNVIDNVTVTDLSASAVSATNPAILITYRWNYVGGYVGYIESGGVIFRMDDSNYANVQNVNIENDAVNPASNDYTYNYFFVNPYVGRIHNGYAINEGSATLSNGSDDYVIPTISTTATDKIVYTYSNPNLNFVINNEEQLFLLSAAINSYSMSVTGDLAYNDVVRGRGIDSYDNVGSTTITYETINEDKPVISCNSYLLSKYFAPTATDAGYAKLRIATIVNQQIPMNITLTASTYNMIPYGIGFRGLGGATQFDLFGRETPIIKLNSLTGVAGRSEIKLDMFKKHFTSEGNQRIALFPETLCTDNTSISNITISGTVKETTYQYSNGRSFTTDAPDSSDGQRSCAAGLIAYMVDETARGAFITTLTNVRCENLWVEAHSYAGGFFAYYSVRSSTASTVPSLVFIDCSYDNINIESRRVAGGLVGSITTRMVQVSGCAFSNSNILVNHVYLFTADREAAAGGLFGKIYSGYYWPTPKSVIIGGEAAADKVTIDNVNTYCLIGATISTYGNVGAGTVIGEASYLPFDINGLEITNCTAAALDGTTVKANIRLADVNAAGFAQNLLELFKTGICPAALSGKFVSPVISQTHAGAVIGYASTDNYESSNHTNASMQNIVIDNCKILAGQNAAALVGFDGQNYNTMIFDNIEVKNSSMIAYVGAGGIVGYYTSMIAGSDFSNIHISDCLISTIKSVHGGAGGIIGSSGSNYSFTISDSSTKDSTIIGRYVGGAIGSGAYATVNGYTVENCNLFGHDDSSGPAINGGLIGRTTNSSTCYLNDIILKNNRIVTCTNNTDLLRAQTGGLIGLASSGAYVYGNRIVWCDNLIGRRSSTSSLNTIQGIIYYFATSPLVITDASYAGVFAGRISGYVNLLGVSRKDSTATAVDEEYKCLDSGAKFSIVYANYLEAGQTGTDLSAEDIFTDPNVAFGSNTLVGDAIGFDGTVWLPLVINNTPWWQNKYAGLSASTINVNNIPAFQITLNPDIIDDYVNMLTGGGFGDWDSSMLDVTSYSYHGTVASGTLNFTYDSNSTTPNCGSVIYDSSTGSFVKNPSGNYDSVSDGTFTVVTITFTNPDGNGTETSYSMNIIVFFQILDVTITVKPIGHEEHNITSYINILLANGMYSSMIVKGGIFSTLVEYRYNEAYTNLQGLQFSKSVSFGTSLLMGTNKLPTGTQLTLIDLNTKNGIYKVYYQTLTTPTATITWDSFLSSGTYSYVAMDELDNATATSASEKYLIVVQMPENDNFSLASSSLPQHAARMEANLTAPSSSDVVFQVSDNSIYGSITVWNPPTVSISSPNELMSNFVSKNLPLDVNLKPSATYTTEFVDAMQAAGTIYYGVIRISIKRTEDGTGTTNYIPLPNGLFVEFENPGQGTLYKLASGNSTYIDIPLVNSDGTPTDLLANPLNAAGYDMTLDFSTVDISTAFPTGSSYKLEANFYLTQLIDVPLSGFKSEEPVELDLSIVNSTILSVTPLERSSLGVNLHGSELDAYLAKRGEIGFTVYCEVPNIDTSSVYSLQFVLQKKGNDNAYHDVGTPSDYLMPIAPATQVFPTWNYNLTGVPNGSTFIKTTDTLAIKLNPAISEYANYKLVINLVKDNGLPSEAIIQSTYFIFTVSKLNTLIQ